MRASNFIKGSLLVMAPLAFFGGCSKGNAPVGPALLSSASITVPLTDAHGKDFSSTQVKVLYYIGGNGGSPVTGNAGTVSASTGNSFSFDVKLPSGNSYSYVAVQINDANNNLIAAGATTFSSGTVPVTLGPVNKPVYQVTLGMGSAFGFEADSVTAIGANTATNAPGLDVVCNQSSDGTGFELDNPALTNSTVAYMGNGNFVNYLQLPSAFSKSSSASKVQFATGPSSMAPGDVYCVKMLAGGYAWLQVVSVSVAGPAFVYRVNTTLPYCGYEQTTADASSIAAGSPTPTATALSAAITIVASDSITVSSPYDVAVLGPANAPATTVFVPSSNGYISAFDVPSSSSVSFNVAGLLNPIGIEVDPTGSYLYVAYSTASTVYQFQINGNYSFTAKGPIGGGVVASAAQGGLTTPRYLAFDNSSDLFITDSGTNNVANVMEYLGPAIIPIVATTNVSYWNGSLSGVGGNSIGQVAVAGTTIVVANSSNNRIDFYSSTGSSVASLSSDNNSAGPVTFSNPQGVAYSAATGYLYISDTGHNRIVEMTLSGAFVKVLGPTFGTDSLNGPTGIKLDNAQPPNIYVADTGHGRVVMLQ